MSDFSQLMGFLNGINALTLIFVLLLMFVSPYRFQGILMAHRLLGIPANKTDAYGKTVREYE